MILPVVAMFALSCYYPNRNTNIYYPLEDYRQELSSIYLQATLDTNNGWDSCIFSYYDNDNNRRVDLFSVAFTYEASDDLYYLSLFNFTSINYYGVFTIFDNDTEEYVDSTNVNLYELNSDTDIPLAVNSFSYEYSSPSFILSLNYLDTNQYNSLTANTDYNKGYVTGYDTGYDVGFENGQNGGYIEGYDEGYGNGYTLGYQNGAAAVTRDYGFTDLFMSVADTPILMFRSLFNFSLFGTPLLSVLLSLFTSILFIFFVKKLIK